VLALAEAGTKVQVAGVHPSTPPSAPWRPGDQCHRDGARTGGRYLATCCAALVTRGLSSAQGGVNLRGRCQGPGLTGTRHPARRRAQGAIARQARYSTHATDRRKGVPLWGAATRPCNRPPNPPIVPQGARARRHPRAESSPTPSSTRAECGNRSQAAEVGEGPRVRAPAAWGRSVGWVGWWLIGRGALAPCPLPSDSARACARAWASASTYFLCL
jgi:hypothetical protein